MEERLNSICNKTIEEIDRFSPWFLIGMVLFYTALTSTMVSIVLYYTNFFESSFYGFIVRFLLFFVSMLMPIYASIFPMLKISKMLRYRTKLKLFLNADLIGQSEAPKMNMEELVRNFRKVMHDNSQIPRFIFFSFLLLVFAALLSVLILPLYYGF